MGLIKGQLQESIGYEVECEVGYFEMPDEIEEYQEENWKFLKKGIEI